MKSLTTYCLFLSWLLAFGCQPAIDPALIELESSLPGRWQIDTLVTSVLVQNSSGTSRRDTMVVDLGVWDIPGFGVEDLDLNAAEPANVLTTLTSDSVQVFPEIEHLFLSEDRYFAYLRLYDETNLNTPLGDFLFDSQLFQANCFVTVLPDGRVRFSRAANETGSWFVMSRI